MFHFLQYLLIGVFVNGFIGKMHVHRWRGSTTTILSSQQLGVANELIIKPKSNVEPPEIVMPLDMSFLDILFPPYDNDKNKRGNGTTVHVPNGPTPVPVFGVSLI